MATSELAPAYAPEDPTLPKPWTGLIDGSTGVLYYWNPETNATQYEKPAALPPPSAMGPPAVSTPSLAPIPVARSQAPNDTIPPDQSDRQMPQHQPMHQVPNHQTHPPGNQPTHHYQYMQMNPMAPPQYSKTNEHPVPQYHSQQQHGVPNGNPPLQQNGFSTERDLRRQVGEPAGFTAPPIQQTSGASGDHRFSGPVPHFPQAADYSVRPEQHFGRSQSTCPGGNFNELPQGGTDVINRHQPLGGPAATNQIGNALSRPFMGQKMGFSDDQHGRGIHDYYSSNNKEGAIMHQQQPQLGNIPHPGNQQDIRMGTLPQPVTSPHPNGLSGQEVAMPKFHDRPAFTNMRGPPQAVFGSTNIPAADSYCQHHEIIVTGDNIPAPFTTFAATGFPPEILREMRYLLQRRAYVVSCAAIHPSRQQLLCP